MRRFYRLESSSTVLRNIPLDIPGDSWRLKWYSIPRNCSSWSSSCTETATRPTQKSSVEFFTWFSLTNLKIFIFEGSALCLRGWWYYPPFRHFQPFLRNSRFSPAPGTNIEWSGHPWWCTFSVIAVVNHSWDTGLSILSNFGRVIIRTSARDINIGCNLSRLDLRTS